MIPPEEHNRPLDRWLGSKLKYLRREQYRQLASHHGLARGRRGVVNQKIEEILVAGDSGFSAPVEPSDKAKMLELIRMYIMEHQPDERRRELIERCLIGGESPVDIAAEYGETPRNASSIVSRARKYLQIRIRKAPKTPAKTRRRKKPPGEQQK